MSKRAVTRERRMQLWDDEVLNRLNRRCPLPNRVFHLRREDFPRGFHRQYFQTRQDHRRQDHWGSRIVERPAQEVAHRTFVAAVVGVMVRLFVPLRRGGHRHHRKQMRDQRNGKEGAKRATHADAFSNFRAPIKLMW